MPKLVPAGPLRLGSRNPRPVSLVMLLVVLAGLVACGESPLGRVGERASGWIGQPTIAASGTTAAESPSLAPMSRVHWFNSDLAPVVGTTPSEIVSAVYGRANPSDPFVQATPAEIALALPGVEFPSQVPPEVRFVTSQLVFDLGNVTLAVDQVAAFGLWTVEPYTRSRSVGQQGVFTVVADPEGLAALESGTADTSCARYIDRQAGCSVSEVDGGPAWELTDQLGATLIWYSDFYRYELFLRSGIDPALAIEMADSVRSLQNLAN